MLNFNAELKKLSFKFFKFCFWKCEQKKNKKTKEKQRKKRTLEEATWAGPTEPHLRQHLPVRLPKKISPKTQRRSTESLLRRRPSSPSSPRTRRALILRPSPSLPPASRLVPRAAWLSARIGEVASPATRGGRWRSRGGRGRWGQHRGNCFQGCGFHQVARPYTTIVCILQSHVSEQIQCWAAG